MDTDLIFNFHTANCSGGQDQFRRLWEDCADSSACAVRVERQWGRYSGARVAARLPGGKCTILEEEIGSAVIVIRVCRIYILLLEKVY